MQLDGVALVDIFVIAAAPVKCIARFAFDAADIDIALGEQIEIILRKVFADDADDSHRGKETRAEGEVRGRTAQDALRRTERRLDRIKGNRANNQDTHRVNPKPRISNQRYFPMIGRRAARTFLGISAGCVIIASFNAEAQPQTRSWVNEATARRIVFCASSTFCLSTASTRSISTSPAGSFQQSSSVANASVLKHISASRASFASCRLVMPMTWASQLRYKCDSARVENCGPSMHR